MAVWSGRQDASDAQLLSCRKRENAGIPPVRTLRGRDQAGRGGWVRVIFATLLIATAGLTHAADIQGHIDLTSEGKELRPEEAQDAVVYFRPKGAPKAKAAAAPYVMGTRHKQFVPRVLPVTVGSQVRFPNDDPILHNAFSTSKDNAFDVGLYGEGEGQVVTFSRVGYVRIYCNVHHSMTGHILVLDTPYFVRPDSGGNFHLADVPAVPGDLVVWHERATPWVRELTPAANDSERVQLDLSQRLVPVHMNKFGKPYGRSDDGGY
jgi:plastocyanin